MALDLAPVQQTCPAETSSHRCELVPYPRADGALTGVNVEATVALAQETGLQVIASGGVSSVEDIRRLAASGAVAGAVIGMALYEGRITLQDALEAAGVRNAGYTDYPLP